MVLTHEELLEEIKMRSILWDTDKHQLQHQSSRALIAVVELHKPIRDDWFNVDEIICKECTREEYTQPYPCPTIQAIEKELG